MGDDIGEGKSKAARQFAIVPTMNPLHSSSVTSAKATKVLGSLGTKIEPTTVSKKKKAMLVNCSSVLLRTVKDCLRTASRRLRLVQYEPVGVGVPGCLVTHHTHTFLAPLKIIIVRQ